MRDLSKVGVRQKLPLRNEPYWQSLGGTGYIGYRKSESGVETWQARWRGEYLDQSTGTVKSGVFQRSLGKLSDENDYQAACKEAQIWITQCERGIPKTATVEDACKAYVRNCGKDRPTAALHAGQQFKKLVYGKTIGKKRLDKLRAIDVRNFRDSLVTDKRQKITVNRIMRIFKAAMNFAKRNQMVDTDVAWQGVEQYKCKEGRRENYLTKEQIQDLLDAAPEDLENYIQGLVYTGARPGDLARATVADFDPKTGTLTLETGKGRGYRKYQSSFQGEPLRFFKELTRWRKATDPLLPAANGESWYKMSWQRGISQLRKDVESIPDNFVAYDLRHTTISRWVADGVPVATVAQVTGTSIKEIQKHYHKFEPSVVAEQLSRIFNE